LTAGLQCPSSDTQNHAVGYFHKHGVHFSIKPRVVLAHCSAFSLGGHFDLTKTQQNFFCYCLMKKHNVSGIHHLFTLSLSFETSGFVYLHLMSIKHVSNASSVNNNRNKFGALLLGFIDHYFQYYVASGAGK